MQGNLCHPYTAVCSDSSYAHARAGRGRPTRSTLKASRPVCVIAPVVVSEPVGHVGRIGRP